MTKPADKSRAERQWESDWDHTTKAARRVADAGPDMLKLAELQSSPDGYPARSIGDGVASANSDTSTERAALAEFPDDDPDKDVDDKGQPVIHPGPDERVTHVDRIDKWAAEFFEHSRLARQHLAKADRIAHLVAKRAEHKERMERKGGHCRACQRFVSGTIIIEATAEGPKKTEDRLRNLLCQSCWTAWCRWKSPQLAATGDAPMSLFLAERRAALEIDEEGNCVHCGRAKDAVDHEPRCRESRRVKAS